MMVTVFSGKTFVTDNNTTAYKISHNYRWKECGTDAEALGQWLFEPIIANAKNVPGAFKSRGYEVVVSGVDFGGGFKSNDHPVLTVKGGGIKLIISEKFNRIFFRNAINLGMPVIACPGILEIAHDGDIIEGDIATGLVKNLTTGIVLQGKPLSKLALDLILSGGLLPYWKAKLSDYREQSLSNSDADFKNGAL
jgi:3-isopropylmalate/(R)-2-methylmalate dehydratase small subunit